MKKIIGLAAPARSGKDTVASMLLLHENVIAYALADPLKLGCQVLFGLTDEETWRDITKENIIPLWKHSPRELFQLVGTDWMRTHNSEHWLMRAEQAISSTIKSEILSRAIHIQDPKDHFKLAAQAFFGLSEKQTWDSNHAEIIDKFWKISPRHMLTLIETFTIKDFPDYFEKRKQRPNVQPNRNIPLFGENDVIIIKDIRFENEADFIRRHNGFIWHIIRNDAQKVNPHKSERGIEVKKNDVIIYNNNTIEQLAKNVDQKWLSFINRPKSFCSAY